MGISEADVIAEDLTEDHQQQQQQQQVEKEQKYQKQPENNDNNMTEISTQQNNNDDSDLDSCSEDQPDRRNTIPKVDRYGFLVTHRLHGKVLSLPNPSLTSEIGKRREQKWLDMIHNWETFINKKQRKVRFRCQKGIPQAIRSLAWQHMCGAVKLRESNPNLFEQMLNEEDTKWADVISKDIPRTFRHHCMFSKEKGQGADDLYKVLIAYSTYNSSIGYNQALAPVAAVLLMHMPPDESFWVLVSICKFYVPGYYGDGMETMRLDGLIFDKLLQKHVPHVSKHMRTNRIDPLMYIVEWMVCMFARCLPFQTVLRIWDMFFCEGVKVLFKVGLALLKLTFPTAKDLEDKDDFKTTQMLLDLPKEVTLETVLIPAAIKINITEKEFENVHQQIYKENPELSIRRYYSTTLKLD